MITFKIIIIKIIIINHKNVHIYTVVWVTEWVVPGPQKLATETQKVHVSK